MSMNLQRHREMLQLVAEALGAVLRTPMAFVGGCTTGLLLTDAFSQDQVRHTDDVDLIVHVLGYADIRYVAATAQTARIPRQFRATRSDLYDAPWRTAGGFYAR